MPLKEEVGQRTLPPDDCRHQLDTKPEKIQDNSDALRTAPKCSHLWQKYCNSARKSSHCHLSITLIVEVHGRKTEVRISKGRQSLKVKKQIAVLADWYDGPGEERKKMPTVDFKVTNTFAAGFSSSVLKEFNLKCHFPLTSASSNFSYLVTSHNSPSH